MSGMKHLHIWLLGLILLNNQIQEEINQVISKFPVTQKKSPIIESLLIIQHHNNGYLTDELIEELAKYLDVQKIDVYEVATFYAHFNIVKDSKDYNPVNVVRVCESLTCELFGAHKLLQDIKN